MFKLVTRLMQKPYEAKNKTDYIRKKLEDGHRISQLGLMDLCQRDGAMNMYTTRLGSSIFRLKRDMPIKKEMVTSGNGARYAEYYLEDK